MYDELEFKNCDHSKDPILSCALEGVASVAAGIKDASVVIHSPQGCAATVGAAYDAHEVDFTRRKIACTRLFETDVIMGASEKLKSMIREADKTFQTKVIFVIGTCAADIIGEDMDGICKDVQPEVNAKLIPILAGGFRGNSNDGINLGMQALLPFIKTGDKIPNSVNIIAPQSNINPTWWADLKWVKDTLQFLGIKVLSVLPYDISFSDLENAGRASANILLSSDAGYEFAYKMQENYKIPLILDEMPLPIGLNNTAKWLRSIGKYFDVEEKVELLIEKGEEKVADVLRKRALMIIPRYRNTRVAVSADATIGISIIRMLFEELEMIPELILIRSNQTSSKKMLNDELEKLKIHPKVAFGVDGYQIQESLENSDIDVVIGSAWEKYMAEEIGIKAAFDVFSPTNRDVYVDRAYFGYDGMLNMLEVFANDWERAFRSKKINFELY
ncbi:MAG: nitrogenase component 1 [Bacillota bacterium]|nr:nitrogenase component 1 [Bacillota bacterium]